MIRATIGGGILVWRWLVLLGCLGVSPVCADSADWWSVTLDNDVFVGDDSGYTNGLFLSRFNLQTSASPLWHWPLLWTLPESKAQLSVQSYTVGQFMLTPEDISLEIPDPDDFPYVGALFVNANYIRSYTRVADKLSSVLGVVGPSSLAGDAQRALHRVSGSTAPRGWDTQEDDELVFQIGRGRLWRSWVSRSGRVDFLSSAELTLGTVESALNGALTWRYGGRLEETFAAPLLSSLRTTNPVAINGAWYTFASLSSAYTFNQVFNDGNSLAQEGAPEYDRAVIQVDLGIALSRRTWSLTLALSDMVPFPWVGADERIRNQGSFGTITFAWQP